MLTQRSRPSVTCRSAVADYTYWDSLPSVDHGNTSYVRHVRTGSPLEVVVDGQSRHGVVMKPGKSFDLYVSQANAFMALAREQYGSTA